MILRRFQRPPPDLELEEVRHRLRKTRRRVRRLRTEVARAGERNRKLRATLERTQDEIALLRSFSLDVFPGLELPTEVEAVLAGVAEQRLTYLEPPHLRALVSCVIEAERAGRPGAMVEAGTALGGSAIAMAAAKDSSRPMFVYDAFGMIPPPSENDTEREVQRYRAIAAGESRGLGGDVYYGYRDDLLAEVTESFGRFGLPPESSGVRLVPGLFEDTIDLDEPVALAHIDGDWYDSTMVCLDRLAPLLVPGGRLVIDDYYHWAGCRAAVDDYFAARSGYRIEHRARVHVVRVT